MCGRFTLTADPGVVARRFGAPPAQGGGTMPQHQPRYNIAPTQTVVTVTTVTDDGERRLEQMCWGLVPAWAKDPTIGSKLINARAETLAEKPAFRRALRRRRCIVPADGFYEWVAPPGVPGGGPKRPVRITLASGEPFGFAGLWDTWHGPDGEALRTCTIVTTTANALVRAVHHRMPVILSQEAEAVWLDPARPACPARSPPPRVHDAWAAGAGSRFGRYAARNGQCGSRQTGASLGSPSTTRGRGRGAVLDTPEASDGPPGVCEAAWILG